MFALQTSSNSNLLLESNGLTLQSIEPTRVAKTNAVSLDQPKTLHLFHSSCCPHIFQMYSMQLCLLKMHSYQNIWSFILISFMSSAFCFSWQCCRPLIYFYVLMMTSFTCIEGESPLISFYPLISCTTPFVFWFDISKDSTK